MSEGWWGIDGGAWSTVVTGALAQRHVCYTLSDAPGFVAEGNLFCTQNAAFTLIGADGDCAARAAMAAMPINAPLQVSGDMITMGDITVEAAIAALERGFDPFASQRAAMKGAWISQDDPQSRLDIRGSEETDSSGGQVLGVSVLTLADRCGDQAQGGVLLARQGMGADPADLQCYAVLDISANRMELSYIGRGNTLVYIRP